LGGTVTPKKPAERNRVISLVNYLGIDLDPEDTESPDFLIRSEKHTIGIEVTSLVSTRAPNQDNPNQAARVFDDLVGCIFAQYTEAGGPPVDASLKFRDGIRIAREDMARVARELGVVLARKFRELHAGQQHPPAVEASLDLYGLVCVAAWPCLAGRSPRWHRDVSGMVDNARSEDILATLSGKEGKIETYRLRADEIWLLIVCDFMANGLFIDPPAEPVPFRINSGFDRLFCLAWTGAYAVEVPLVRPPSGQAAGA
jgi:hypothetical protein